MEKTASLPGMRLAVRLPDLHPGKGSPIGAALAVEGYLYPTLVGNDIGCGIGLWRTELSAKKLKREAWADRPPSARSAAGIILRSCRRSRASRILNPVRGLGLPAMRFICASTADRVDSVKRSCATPF